MTTSNREHPPWWHLLNALIFGVGLAGVAVVLLVWGGEATVSAGEKRALASPPVWSVEAFTTGRLSTGIDAYVNDRFPFRERLLAGNFWLRAHLGLTVTDEAFYDVAVLEEESVQDWEDGTPEELQAEPAPEDTGPPAAPANPLGEGTPEAPGGSPGEEPPPVAQFALTPPDPPLRVAAATLPVPREAAAPKPAAGKNSPDLSRGILIYGGRAMQVFGGSDRLAKRFAEAVNAYRAALPPEVRVYAEVIPSPAAFYLPADKRHGSRPEKPNIDAAYAALVDGVIAVDAFTEMERHKDEYLYFRTDHHWTGLGAYYGYRAFCQAADLQPVSLEAMTRHTRHKWMGSLYWYTRDPRLRDQRDEVDYYVPPGEWVSRRYGSTMSGKGTSHPLFWGTGDGYGVFLGGDYPLIAVTTAVANGRRALVVKNSFGNAFAPYLVSHFEEVIVLDYRSFKGSLLDLVRDQKITDVVLINQMFAVNTPYHPWRLKVILKGEKSIRKPKPESEVPP